jgi:hypothetical protein
VTATSTAPFIPVAITRLRCHEQSRNYEKKRTSEGKTHRDVRRSLKRILARRFYRLMQGRHGYRRAGQSGLTNIGASNGLLRQYFSKGHRPLPLERRRPPSRRRGTQRQATQDTWMEDARRGTGRTVSGHPTSRCCVQRLSPVRADSNGRRNTLIRRCWSGTSAKLGHSGDGKAGDAVARPSGTTTAASSRPWATSHRPRQDRPTTPP